MKIRTWLKTIIISLSITFLAGAQTLQSDSSSTNTSNRQDTIWNATQLAQLDKEGKCNVHHQALKKEIVPIHYGLIIDIGDENNALFPNAKDWVRGGCVVADYSPKQALVLQCQECLAAKKIWFEKEFPNAVKEKKKENR